MVLVVGSGFLNPRAPIPSDQPRSRSWKYQTITVTMAVTRGVKRFRASNVPLITLVRVIAMNWTAHDDPKASLLRFPFLR